jgi:hypothetical protein
MKMTMNWPCSRRWLDKEKTHMSELFLFGSLVITTVGTLVGYFIGRSEAKGEYEKINNRNLRAMNELENEIEALTDKIIPPVPPGNGGGGWVRTEVQLPKEVTSTPALEEYLDLDPDPAEEKAAAKAKKKPAEKKQTPKRKKGKK